MPGDVRLLVAGQAWDAWTSYDLDADYLTAADGWTVSARNPDAVQLATLVLGSPVQILVDTTPILMGTLERIESSRSLDAGHVISLSGRDLAGALVDASPGTAWAIPSLSLAAAAQKILAELAVPAVVLAAAEANVPRLILRPEPGESFWDVLVRYARKLRLGVWMDPVGVLHIDRPDYLSPPVAELVHATSLATAGGTNVMSIRYVDDITGRRSPVTVVGQSAGGGLFAASTVLVGAAIDPTLTVIRPALVDDGDINSVLEATDRARWEVASRQFEGKHLTVTVQGHLAMPGVPWSPGQMVQVRDELHGIIGPWWVRARRFSRSLSTGSTTELVLHPPNLYLPAV